VSGLRTGFVRRRLRSVAHSAPKFSDVVRVGNVRARRRITLVRTRAPACRSPGCPRWSRTVDDCALRKPRGTRLHGFGLRQHVFARVHGRRSRFRTGVSAVRISGKSWTRLLAGGVVDRASYGSDGLRLHRVLRGDGFGRRIRFGFCVWTNAKKPALVAGDTNNIRELARGVCRSQSRAVDEPKLLQKLRDLEALFAGATTDGERVAAGTARDRILMRLNELEQSDPPVEYRFTLVDGWSKRLFLSILRRYELKPYRYRSQRHTTVMVRVPKGFVDKTLWPLFQRVNEELRRHLDEVAERVISTSMEAATGDEEVREQTPLPLTATESHRAYQVLSMKLRRRGQLQMFTWTPNRVWTCSPALSGTCMSKIGLHSSRAHVICQDNVSDTALCSETRATNPSQARMRILHRSRHTGFNGSSKGISENSSGNLSRADCSTMNCRLARSRHVVAVKMRLRVPIVILSRAPSDGHRRARSGELIDLGTKRPDVTVRPRHFRARPKLRVTQASRPPIPETSCLDLLAGKP
jgi:hypothetical protein